VPLTRITSVPECAVSSVGFLWGPAAVSRTCGVFVGLAGAPDSARPTRPGTQLPEAGNYFRGNLALPRRPAARGNSAPNADSARFRIASASTMNAHIWTSYASLFAAVADVVAACQSPSRRRCRNERLASAPTVLAACSYEPPAVLHLLGGHHVADRDPGNADQPGADPSARRLPLRGVVVRQRRGALLRGVERDDLPGQVLIP